MDVNSHAKFLEERLQKYKEKLKDQASSSAAPVETKAANSSLAPQTPSLNAFNNDGSFMDQFRKLTSKNKDGNKQQTTISNQSKALLMSKSKTYQAMLEAKKELPLAREAKVAPPPPPSVLANPFADDSDDGDAEEEVTPSKSSSSRTQSTSKKSPVTTAPSNTYGPPQHTKETNANGSQNTYFTSDSLSEGMYGPLPPPKQEPALSAYGTPYPSKHLKSEPVMSEYGSSLPSSTSDYGSSYSAKQESGSFNYGPSYSHRQASSMSEYGGSQYPSTHRSDSGTAKGKADDDEYDPFAPTDDGDSSPSHGYESKKSSGSSHGRSFKEEPKYEALFKGA